MDTENLSDEELLESLEESGHFEELYRRHTGKITTFATRRCSTVHEVPDLVAAVWLEVIASAHSFDTAKGAAVPWIFGVAANLTASNERRRAREHEALKRLGRRPHLDDQTAAELHAQIDAAAPARRAMEVLRSLPSAERLIAELVLIEGLEPAEAARSLGIRPATGRMRLMRARKKLRASLAPFSMSDRPLNTSEV
jgi:RNA polymerase sigma factor (sigma-70 family)